MHSSSLVSGTLSVCPVWYMCMHACVCCCAHLGMWLWRPEVHCQLYCPPLSPLYFILWNRSSHWAESSFSTSLTGQRAPRPDRSLPHPHSQCWCTDLCCRAHCSPWELEYTSLLVQQVIYPQNHLDNPTIIFENETRVEHGCIVRYVHIYTHEHTY